MPPQLSDQPVKKQSKWSAEEDSLIIELRGSGMKWEDVSKRLPGRSAISCRLHYQNYLERRSEWDEERKNKLARLYERFKAEMWAKVAEELAVPWRAAEAMHWQLGETDMARRAGVVPFSLAAVNVESGHRNMQTRGHVHSQSQDTAPRDSRPLSPRSTYAQSHPMAPVPINRTARRDAVPPPTAPPPAASQRMMRHDSSEYGYSTGPGLAPIQGHAQAHISGALPGFAELTTGVGAYPSSGAMHRPSYGAGDPAYIPNLRAYSTPTPEPVRTKRRATPDMGREAASHRRRIG